MYLDLRLNEMCPYGLIDNKSAFGGSRGLVPKWKLLTRYFYLS